MTDKQTSLPANKFGNKVICKRPGSLAFCAQVVNIENGVGTFKKELNLDFGEMPNGQPDFSNKKTVRLNKGEVAHLFGCVLGYLPKAGAGHRESGLWVSFNTEDNHTFINLLKDKNKLKYVKLQASERFQIYQLCLECLKSEGQSSQDILIELKTFFGQL